MLHPVIRIAIRKTFIIITMALFFISTISFSNKVEVIQNESSTINMINGQVSTLQKALKTDIERRVAIEKILQIISEYNDNLADTLKHTIAGEIYKMSVKYSNLDVDLICATITHESARTWDPTVISPAGALGLMQIMPYTGLFISKHEGIEWTTPKEVLFDPIKNIRMGCRYLSNLIELYNVDGGLAAYNGGERRAARWLASGRNDDVLFEETRTYVPAILKLYETYKN